MSDRNIEHFKKKLEEEKARLETELKTVGRVNPQNPDDWEATPSKDFDSDSADPNEQADAFEEYDERAAILNSLELQYNDVKAALEKIEAGTYGICEISGEEIETDRLEANPAARTCKAHM